MRGALQVGCRTGGETPVNTAAPVEAAAAVGDSNPSFAE